MGGLRTEFTFTLPKGYVDGDGTLHRQGTMRLATARDEIEPLRDPRVADANDPYLTVIVLSRVITRIGTVTQVTPKVVEDLFAADLAFLQDVYGIVNFGDPADLAELQAAVLGDTGDDDDDGYDDGFEDEAIDLGGDDLGTADVVDDDTVGSAAVVAEYGLGRRSAIQEVKVKH